MRYPQAATVIATVALFVALGGPATAAKLIRGADIKDGSITQRDLSKQTRKALKGKTGRRGAAGAPGVTGARGLAGASGPAGAKGDKGDKGDAGEAAVLQRMSGDVEAVHQHTGDAAENFVDSATLGTFTKQRADSVLEVRYATHMLSSGGLCILQLRVGTVNADGNTSVSGNDAGYDGFEAIGSTGQYAPAFMQSTFAGIPAGTHALKLFIRSGNGVTCTENPGVFERTWTVLEVAR